MVFQRWMGRREKKAFWIKAHEKFERIIKTIPLKKWLLFTMEIFVDEGEEKKTQRRLSAIARCCTVEHLLLLSVLLSESNFIKIWKMWKLPFKKLHTDMDRYTFFFVGAPTALIFKSQNDKNTYNCICMLHNNNNSNWKLKRLARKWKMNTIQL